MDRLSRLPSARLLILLAAVAVNFPSRRRRPHPAPPLAIAWAYLDGNDPFYPNRDFPSLTTPQWVGEPGVEAVVILAIDDNARLEKIRGLPAPDPRAP